MKTMKSNYNIQSYADLEREEIRVKKRLKKQEEELKLKLRTLPEELVTTGVTKAVTGILNGDLFRAVSGIFKIIKNVFANKEASGESGNSVTDIIKNVIRQKFST